MFNCLIQVRDEELVWSVLQQQSCVVAKESVWPAKSKIFTGLFRKSLLTPTLNLWKSLYMHLCLFLWIHFSLWSCTFPFFPFNLFYFLLYLMPCVLFLFIFIYGQLCYMVLILNCMHLTGWDKMFANHVSCKVLVSKIIKKFYN